MRPAAVLVALLVAPALRAQLRINEVQCTRLPGSDGQGPNGDWVELFNAGNQAVELGGHLLVLDGVITELEAGLAVKPHGRAVVWCDRHPELGPDHVDLNLPRRGGTLLLVAPDRTTILDYFTWPALPAGVSIGRSVDGSTQRGYFAQPSPGTANTHAARSLLRQPVITGQGGATTLSAAAPSTIRYTVDGSIPGESSATYTSPLHLPEGTVVTARCFATDAVASACAVFTTAVPDSAWALMIAPEDLAGKEGIADVPTGNYARKGAAWQRQAWLQRGGDVLPVGIAIAGNGTRSLPKRNFRLLVRDRFNGQAPVIFPDGKAWKEVILRADATPGAFLRNRFIKVVAQQSGGRVEVQPDDPIALQLNGRDQGLYRAMPAKGREWVERLSGGLATDIVEGPGARAVDGSAKDYRRMLKAITGGQPLDSVQRMADVNSLVELACLDLWTGRADHDLNVRCWKPRTPQGRWRWVLFDMDQWAPPQDRTVDRMCSSPVPETPFLPQLLADPGLRDRLLARLSALLATTLAPDHAAPIADSLFELHRQAMAADHALWKDRMPMPAPEESYAMLIDHIKGRNGPLLRQLSARTGLALHTLKVQVEPKGAGTVLVEELPLRGTGQEVQAFSGVPLHLRAVPGPGMEFAGWKSDAVREGAVTPRRDERITAVFRPAALSSQGGLQQ